MNPNKNNAGLLENVKVNVKIKLSVLWITLIFCYLYGDLYQYYVPGWINEIIAGNMGTFGPTTQIKMVGGAIFMTIPAAMVFLSLTLKPKVNRWVNIIVGILYIVPVVFTMFMAPWYYSILLGIVEIVLKVLIVWYAWKWPKQEG